jgi:hypothetical protein
MSTKTEAEEGEGVQFPLVDGKRSSQRSGKQLFAEAVRNVDPELFEQIQKTSDWRKNYLEPVKRIVEVGATSAAKALRIAADGTKAVRDTMVFERDGASVALAEAFDTPRPDALDTFEIKGEGTRSGNLEVPFGKENLSGDRLRKQLDRWADKGTIEQSCSEAVKLVVANPDWMDLSDLHFAVLGGASEMGPMRALCHWGATVYAIDLPRPRLWELIRGISRDGTGKVLIPTKPGGSSENLVESAGTDLLSQGPEVRAWLSSFDTPLAVGDYTYADGTTFVRVSAAVDALTEGLRRDGKLRCSAYLATPTDVFAVPEQVAEETKNKKESISASGARLATLRRMCKPNYETLVSDEGGRRWGLSDCLVAQQGANYALAKNLQKWRATELRQGGLLTSANVAPPTRTHSVTKNRILAAAYNGGSTFGVTAFAPPTARTLMAALLVHDLRNPKAPANPENDLAHPYELLTDAAAHGGIWRLKHEPRTILPLAVLVGFAKRSPKNR